MIGGLLFVARAWHEALERRTWSVLVPQGRRRARDSSEKHHHAFPLARCQAAHFIHAYRTPSTTPSMPRHWIALRVWRARASSGRVIASTTQDPPHRHHEITKSKQTPDRASDTTQAKHTLTTSPPPTPTTTTTASSWPLCARRPARWGTVWSAWT